MKRLFKKYTDWEDYKNGMYEISNLDDTDLIKKSVNLLSDSDLFLSTCKLVVKEWPVTSSVHLTNNTINKKAWLGQASCNYLYNVPETLTRMAWGLLDCTFQDKANAIAETVINSYLNNLENAHNQKLHF